MFTTALKSAAETPESPAHLSHPERLTWDITTPDGADRRFRRKLFSNLPKHLALGVARNYNDRFKRKGLRIANLGLLKEAHALESASSLDYLLGASDDEIRSWATQKAARCHRLIPNPTRAFMEDICRRAGIMPPDPHYADSASIARMTCPHWWRRRGRRVIARRVEAIEIKAGLVNIRSGRYASDDAVNRRAEQKRRDRALLASLHAVNELEDTYTLAELQEHSMSNPRVRRAELMVRLAGFEASP